MTESLALLGTVSEQSLVYTEEAFLCYQGIWVMCANFSMKLLQRKRSVGMSLHLDSLNYLSKLYLLGHAISSAC